MKNEKLEKQASSEIAQSRERLRNAREKWMGDGDTAMRTPFRERDAFDAGYQTAERDTRERLAPAMKFAGLVLDSQSPEAGDIDGGTIEEWLIECGFYKPTEVTEPCSLGETGECGGCLCAEVGFPTVCNRWTDLAREAERIRGKE